MVTRLRAMRVWRGRVRWGDGEGLGLLLLMQLQALVEFIYASFVSLVRAESMVHYLVDEQTRHLHHTSLRY